MKSITQIYKIAYGPNSLLNSASYLASKQIIKIIKTFNVRIHYVEVNLYNDLVRLNKQVNIEYDIQQAFNEEKIKFKIFTNRIPPAGARDPLTIDFLFIDNKKQVLARYRVVSTGGGFFTIAGVPQKETYHFSSWEDFSKAIKKTNLSYYEFACQFENATKLSLVLEKSWSIMEKICATSLSKNGYLKLHDKNIVYKRQAKEIFKNKLRNESQEEKLIREIAAYAFAIGEEIPEKKLMSVVPTACAAAAFWAICIWIKKNYKLSNEKIKNALCAAGFVCAMIEQNGTLSSYIAGCQASMATACAMGAAFCTVALYNANIDEVGRAAEMALEHLFGLTCSTVCGIPIIPCIQRCSSTAVRAYQVAILNHSLMKEPGLVKFDTAIKVMLETGKDLLNKNKHIGLGGYALNAKYSILKNKSSKTKSNINRKGK